MLVAGACMILDDILSCPHVYQCLMVTPMAKTCLNPKKWWLKLLKPQIFAEEISISTQKKLHPDPQSLGLGWEALP